MSLLVCLFPLPSLPQFSFFFSFDTPFLSIHLLHFWTHLDCSAATGWWMCLASHLESSSIRSPALCPCCPCSPDTPVWKTHTLNSPVRVLSDARPESWRPSFHGRRPSRPRCMCTCAIQRWRRTQIRASWSTHFLLHTVYYSRVQPLAEQRKTLNNKSFTYSTALVLDLFPSPEMWLKTLLTNIGLSCQTSSAQRLEWAQSSHLSTCRAPPPPHEARVMHTLRQCRWDFHTNTASPFWPLTPDGKAFSAPCGAH